MASPSHRDPHAPPIIDDADVCGWPDCTRISTVVLEAGRRLCEECASDVLSARKFAEDVILSDATTNYVSAASSPCSHASSPDGAFSPTAAEALDSAYSPTPDPHVPFVVAFPVDTTAGPVTGVPTVCATRVLAGALRALFDRRVGPAECRLVGPAECRNCRVSEFAV